MERDQCAHYEGHFGRDSASRSEPEFLAAHILAGDPAAESNHAEYDHDPRIGTPARRDGMAHLRQIIVCSHTKSVRL